MSFKSINPYNGELITTHKEQSEEEVNEILETSKKAYSSWRDQPISERCEVLIRAAEILKKKKDIYARTITLEMGKPITEAIAEIEKCAWVCEYYAENAEPFLADEEIETDASESYVSFEPIGTVLAIMPWNFPFWQVFRFAAPTIAAGNCALLKHAANVFGCAKHIGEVFMEAGLPDGVFQNLFVNHDAIEDVIASDAVKAVTLTGSERAGSSVAALAGKQIKKTVLELGGSNAFIVLDDADMELAAKTGISARMMNSGQSCISGKRFILTAGAHDKFLPDFVARTKSIKDGNPLDKNTEIGPLARVDLAVQLEEQVRQSVDMGAVVKTGGNRNKAYFEPTVLLDVTPDMPVFKEETFGPVAAIIRAEDEDHAIELAANSKYGLGASIFTKDLKKAKRISKRIPDGAFFVNELVKSDPRLPFGGTKTSGYGRELSRQGIREFVNQKTVYIK